MDFYVVDEEYIAYLQDYERTHRNGITRVPKEYNFCIKNKDRIEKKAHKIYDMVTNNKKQKLTDNSCDFTLLEEAYLKYCKNNI